MDDFQAIFCAFNDRLHEITTFLLMVSQQKDFVKTIYDSSPEKHSTLREDAYVKSSRELINSKVEYNAIIISAYACFENYIDDLLQEYLKSIIKAGCNVDSISTTTKKKYFDKICEYLSSPHRYPAEHLSIEAAIKSVYDCYYGSKTDIIAELLLHHGGNLKQENISNLLSILGIIEQGSLIVSQRDAQDFVSLFLSDSDRQLAIITKPQILFQSLDELVDQRNIIAHTWNSDSRFGESMLRDHIELLLLLGYVILFQVICSYYSKNPHYLHEFPVVHDVFNHNVLCLNSDKAAIKVGDFLYIKDESTVFVAQIKRIEVNRTSVDIVEEPNTDVGLELNRRVKRVQKFYYIQ
ncbi:MAG: MAE_28990/MAE_18760 family HEPN-like nuclease [Clostridiaceae bacterium]